VRIAAIESLAWIGGWLRAVGPGVNERGVASHQINMNKPCHACIRGTASAAVIFLGLAGMGCNHDGSSGDQPDLSPPADAAVADAAVPPDLLPSPPDLRITGPTALVSGLDSPVGIAVDKSFVYFSTFNATGSIQRVALDGGTPTVLVPNQDHPYELAIDATNLYWVNYLAHVEAGQVMQLPLSGGAPKILVDQVNAESLAVDASNVYWSSRNDGNVRSVPIGGGSASTVYPGPEDIAVVRVANGRVYFSVYAQFMPGMGFVRSIPVGGGATTTLASTLNQPLGLAVDAANVYYTEFDQGTAGAGDVRSVPLAGGSPGKVADGQGGPNFIATDGVNVYFSTTTDGTVVRAPVGGGATTTIASGQNGPSFLALDASYVYWTNLGGGQVMKAPK
jgi:hypothetical protein